MLRTLCIALFLVSTNLLPAQAPASPQVLVPAFGNAECPVMGKKASDALYVDTEFGRIYICCAPCVRKIRKAPEIAYKAAYPTVKKVHNTHCPIMGKALKEGHPTVILQGHEIGVCCKPCIQKAQQQPQRALALAHHPKWIEVRNTACPISGEAVDANVLIVIDGHLIPLSSAKHIPAAKKDPKGTLEKARSLAQDKKDLKEEKKQEAGDAAQGQDHD